MSVRMLEKQMVDGKAADIGEVVSTDVTAEAVLVAHGKAEFVEETAQPKLPESAPADETKKGGKP